MGVSSGRGLKKFHGATDLATSMRVGSSQAIVQPLDASVAAACAEGSAESEQRMVARGQLPLQAGVDCSL